MLFLYCCNVVSCDLKVLNRQGINELIDHPTPEVNVAHNVFDL